MAQGKSPGAQLLLELRPANTGFKNGQHVFRINTDQTIEVFKGQTENRFLALRNVYMADHTGPAPKRNNGHIMIGSK